MKPKEDAAIQTEGAYLNRLGRKLLRYFPLKQVDEMLEDYQEHFSLGRERGSADVDMIAALGTPEAVTAAILKEMPEGRSYCLRRTVGWGAVFLFVCWCFLPRYTYIGQILAYSAYEELGTCFLMALGAVASFMLLRGREQAAVEGRFWGASLRPGVVAYILPVAVAAVMEALMQYLLFAAAHGWLADIAAEVGPICNMVINIGSLVTILLVIGGLWRSYGTSIRYFPTAVHAVGALLFIRQIERFLHSMDTLADTSIETYSQMLIKQPLLYYCFGIFLTLLFWYGIRRGIENGRRR